MSGEDHCLVPGCKTTTKDVFSFFPVPDLSKDTEMHEKWITILKIPIQSHYFRQVCQIHFDENQFTSHPPVILKPDAIPRPFLIEQDIKIECDQESTLSLPASDHLQTPKPQNKPTPILMKDLRICLERLPEHVSTSKVKKIKVTPVAKDPYSSKSTFSLGCVLCQNNALLKKEWRFGETAEKFEDLKLFLCTILKLEIRLFKYFPFCRNCTTRVEELYNMYMELRMFQLKFDRETNHLKNDFITIFLMSSGAMSQTLIYDAYGHEVIDSIIQKWNQIECPKITPGLLGGYESPYPWAKPFRTPTPPPDENEPTTPPPIVIRKRNPASVETANPFPIQVGTSNSVSINLGTSHPVSVNLGTANPAPNQSESNQVRKITLPIRFVIQPPKVATATVGVNTEIPYYNVHSISMGEHVNANQLENNVQNSLEPIGEKEINYTHVAELHRKPVDSSSAEDLEDAQNSPKSSIKTENILEEYSEAGFYFEQPVEECESPKIDDQQFVTKNSPGKTATAKTSHGNDEQIVVKEKCARKKPKQVKKRRIRKPRTCPVCFQVKNGTGGLATHMLIHTGERHHQCSDCGKRFVQNAHLSKHKRQVHGYHPTNSAVERKNYLESKNRLYNCDLCNNLYTKTHYLRHIKDLHVNKEIMDGDIIWFYYCDNQDCKNSFSTQNSLRNHFLEDHLQKDADLLNVCDVCDRVFCLKENLEVHKTSHSSVDSDETVYPCSYCYMVFTTEGELNGHIPRHKIEFKLSQFSHLCELCGEGFLSMPSLYHHKTTTTCQTPKIRKQGQSRKVPPHKIGPSIIRGKKKVARWRYISTCEFCGKTGTTCNIKLHRLIHTHPEGFKCNICTYVAKNPSYLKKHIITVHSPTVDTEQKYVCDFCQRCFVNNRMLKVHKIRHHPEEYLQGKVHCISCFQLFDTHESMNVHFEEQHPEKICRVNDCGMKFADKNYLRNHSRVHSKERHY